MIKTALKIFSATLLILIAVFLVAPDTTTAQNNLDSLPIANGPITGTNVVNICGAGGQSGTQIGNLCAQRAVLELESEGRSRTTEEGIELAHINREILELTLEHEKQTTNDPARIKTLESALGQNTKSTEVLTGIASEAKKESADKCWGPIAGLKVGACLIELSNASFSFIFIPLLTLVNWFVIELFNISIFISIKSFYAYANSNGINIGWRLIRDLMNLVFIGSLFYIAIGTILQTSSVNWKKMVPSLIIAALLINFSMLFTKILIDASNLLTVTFYEAVNPTPAASGIPDITVSIVQVMGIAKIEAVVEQGSSFPTPKAFFNAFAASIAKDLGKATLLITSSLVLLAAAIMFFTRTITLMFLLVLSPIAFVGMILPNLKPHSSRWWKSLSGELIFAPMYMLCFFVVIKIAESADTVKDVLPGGQDQGFGLQTLLFFIILNGLMLGCLIIAASSKKVGSALAGGILFGGTALLGQATFGRLNAKRAELARERANNPDLTPQQQAKAAALAVRYENRAKRSYDLRNAPGVGSLTKTTGINVGKGVSSSFAKRREDEIKAAQKQSQLVTPQTDAEKQKLKSDNETTVEDKKKKLEAVDVEFKELTEAITKLADGKFENETNNIEKRTQDQDKAIEKAQASLNSGLVLSPDQKISLEKEITDAEAEKLKIEADRNTLAQERQNYLEKELKDNLRLTQLEKDRSGLAENIEKRGYHTETGFALTQEKASKEGKELTRDQYNKDLNKNKKHFESGGFARDSYAKLVEEGATKSIYVPFTTWRIPGTGGDLLSSKQRRQEKAAAIRSQKSDTERFTELALKLEKEKAATDKPEAEPAEIPKQAPSDT